MSNGYLTSCALIISAIIIMLFFIKKHDENTETKIFQKMIFINLES